MKIRLELLLVGLMTVFVCYSAVSQSKAQRQSLPIVNYNDNVNSPLTTLEMAQLKEVYGDQLQNLILDRPQRVKDIKNILRNRIIFKKVKPGKAAKNYPLLSTIPLFDTYVENLKRDVVFDEHSFNPLKYEFDFYSRNSYIFHIDNTDYYVIIKSQHQ